VWINSISIVKQADILATFKLFNFRVKTGAKVNIFLNKNLIFIITYFYYRIVT